MNLEKTLHKWQRRLGLEDWDIDISWGNKKQLSPENWGELSGIKAKRRAAIVLRRPEEKGEDMFDIYDVERTIVHELLHVHVGGFADRSNEHAELLEEQAIHAISLALLEGWRRS